jgi:hypothetical protein
LEFDYFIAASCRFFKLLLLFRVAAAFFSLRTLFFSSSLSMIVECRNNVAWLFLCGWLARSRVRTHLHLLAGALCSQSTFYLT